MNESESTIERKLGNILKVQEVCTIPFMNFSSRA